MKVFWTPLARRRLAEIEDYIARDNPKAARAVAARLVMRSGTLEQPPLLGRRLNLPEMSGNSWNAPSDSSFA